MLQSGRKFLVFILLFSGCVHPAHVTPCRKSSTLLTAISYRFKNIVWATFGASDGEQNQACSDSVPCIRHCLSPNTKHLSQRNKGNNATSSIMPKLLEQNQYNYPLACPSRDFLLKSSLGMSVLCVF